MNKWYVSEFQNTLDGSFNYTPENLGDKQLIFGKCPIIAKNKRFVEYDEKIGEEQAVRLFEKIFNVKCKWSSIGYGNQNHLGYKIVEQ